jgi:hypothetical protein
LSRSSRGLRIQFRSTLPFPSLEESRYPQFAFVLVVFLIRAPVTHPAYRITLLGAGFLVFTEGQEEVIAYRALTQTRDVGAVKNRQEFSERVDPLRGNHAMTHPYLATRGRWIFIKLIDH